MYSKKSFKKKMIKKKFFTLKVENILLHWIKKPSLLIFSPCSMSFM